jgi:hypothetical protein
MLQFSNIICFIFPRRRTEKLFQAVTKGLPERIMALSRAGVNINAGKRRYRSTFEDDTDISSGKIHKL